MKAIDLLAREHRLFKTLLDRLESSLANPEESVLLSVRQILETLLPALDRHEEIEDMIFVDPPETPDDGGEALFRVEQQHQAIALLRDELLSALELSNKETCDKKLRSITAFLVTNLREHFDTEERALWPKYKNTLNRILDQDVSAHLKRWSKVQERALEEGIASVPKRSVAPAKRRKGP